MIKKALYGIGMAYLGLSLTACDPQPVLSADGMADFDPSPYRMHIVQKGQTFDEIARDIDVTSNRLNEFNPGIIDRDHIEVGQPIAIPLEEQINSR